MSRLEGDFEGGAAVDVGNGGIALGVGQEEAHDVHVAMFRGAHQGSAAIFVLDVDSSASFQEELGHVDPAVGHGEHQRGLTVLQRIGCFY